MKTTTKPGANASPKNSKIKSFINVKMFEPVSKKFTISSESDSLLTNYAQFLSASSGRKYNTDSIIEALIEKLHEDKNFTAWASAQEEKKEKVLDARHTPRSEKYIIPD